MTLTFAQQMMQVKNVEKKSFIPREKSTLLKMRKRHTECIQRLRDSPLMFSESAEGEEWQRLQEEVENLNKHLLTKSSAAQTLEQMQEEQWKKMDEFRAEVKNTLSR